MLIAIYSRKSKWTGKGESVENQLKMCKEYINSFIDNSKESEILEYEDEGFSGKNTRRPQFQRMMQDMRERHFDCLVCYKLDRLGRNLADLAVLMEQLEQQGTSFVSIKEKFDTNTPIGKAMLYFSGVLAQMEREQIGERVKDNMLMLARSGRWLGGNPPLGYFSAETEKDAGAGKRKTVFYLTEKEDELCIAKLIFYHFLEKQSLSQVVSYLMKNKVKTRNGKEFTASAVRDILVNPVYCMADAEAYDYFSNCGCQICIEKKEVDGISGLVSYAKTTSVKYKNQSIPCTYWIIAKGKHKGIITGRDFRKVQEILECNRIKASSFRKPKNSVSLLAGLLYCSCGHRMRPKSYPETRKNEKGERTFAYRCSYKDSTHGEKCRNRNVHGNTLDDAVCEKIIGFIRPEKMYITLLEELKKCVENSHYRDEMPEHSIYEKEYEKKQEQIRNLLNLLKNMEAEDVSLQYIKGEIQRLDTECRLLKGEIEELHKNQTDKPEKLQIADSIKMLLTDFGDSFSLLPVLEKRELCRKIIEKVVWDGECAHIYLNRG